MKFHLILYIIHSYIISYIYSVQLNNNFISSLEFLIDLILFANLVNFSLSLLTIFIINLCNSNNSGKKIKFRHFDFIDFIFESVYIPIINGYYNTRFLLLTMDLAVFDNERCLLYLFISAELALQY